MTSAVNSPCCRTMPLSHSSNSVLLPLSSALDKGQLLDVLLEQRPERLLKAPRVPAFEVAQLLQHSLGGRFHRSRTNTCERRLDHGRKARQSLDSCLAAPLPAELSAHKRPTRSDCRFLILGGM